MWAAEAGGSADAIGQRIVQTPEHLYLTEFPDPKKRRTHTKNTHDAFGGFR
jgi:hypothetical protein